MLEEMTDAGPVEGIYHMTASLRFVERMVPRDVSIDGVIHTVQPAQVLQQAWQNGRTGHIWWRDVPLSREDYD